MASQKSQKPSRSCRGLPPRRGRGEEPAAWQGRRGNSATSSQARDLNILIDAKMLSQQDVTQNLSAARAIGVCDLNELAS